MMVPVRRMEALIRFVREDQPDLTNRQAAMLMILAWRPGAHTVRSLAKDLNIQKPVVTRALHTLMRMGFIEKRADLNDARSFFVVITVKGRNFIERLP